MQDQELLYEKLLLCCLYRVRQHFSATCLRRWEQLHVTLEALHKKWQTHTEELLPIISGWTNKSMILAA